MLFYVISCLNFFLPFSPSRWSVSSPLRASYCFTHLVNIFTKISYCFTFLYFLYLNKFPSKMEDFNLGGKCYTTPIIPVSSFMEKIFQTPPLEAILPQVEWVQIQIIFLSHPVSSIIFSMNMNLWLLECCHVCLSLCLCFCLCVHI